MLSLKVLFGDAEMSCVTTDVSATGAFLAARNAPPIGANVDIVVRPSGVKMPPVRLRSEVVRVNPIGGPHQPGFAVRFVSIHSDVGGDPIYHVLRRMLRVPDVLPEHLPAGGQVTFDFPAIGEHFALRSAQAPRPSPANTGTGHRMTGRPATPIREAMPPDRRASRVRPRPPLGDDIPTSGGLRRASEDGIRPAGGDNPRRASESLRRRRSTTDDPPSRRASRVGERPMFAVSTNAPLPSRRGSKTNLPKLTVTSRDNTRTRLSEPTDAYEVSEEERQAAESPQPAVPNRANPFLGARPASASSESDVFSPPGASAPPPRAMAPPPPVPDAQLPRRASAAPPRRASEMKATRRETGRPSFAVNPAAPVVGEAEIDVDALDEKTPAGEATFDLDAQEVSNVFTGKRPETSRIVAPFANKIDGRRRSQVSSWSRYESDVHSSVTVRRTSDVIIQDDPFATGARKVGRRLRDKEEEQRKARQAEREKEREALRQRLAGRRNESRPTSGNFTAESEPAAERSMIFSRTPTASTIGGPMLTGMAPSPGLAEGTTVRVQSPVTYELDNRFVGGTLVSAAPLAVEIHTTDRVPQLDQKLVVNLPVRTEHGWRTIYLMGKLLRVPDTGEGGRSFVLHIERVQEGVLKGAYNRFLVEAQSGADQRPA